ncbi:hypothetical protein [Microbacterium sp. P04]|uniref:hypothetical protein n=1 Tax=Microbacterium sp. P04 TaxID=3366947 RepID=UPI00374643D8
MPIELWTAIVAGGSAVLGGLVSGLITLWTTRGADERADAREANRVRLENHARQRRLSEEVAEAFGEQLRALRRYGSDPYEEPFDDKFLDAWVADIEIDLSQKVDRLTDDVLRTRLQLIIASIPDQGVLNERWWERDLHEFATNSVALGRALSMAAVRGQEPDEGAVKDVTELGENRRTAEAQRRAALKAETEQIAKDNDL